MLKNKIKYLIVFSLFLLPFGSVFAVENNAESNQVNDFKQVRIKEVSTEEIVKKEIKENNKIVCTGDAKRCLDGTYVGRVPPKCEFKECPGEELEKDKIVCTMEYNPVCAIITTDNRCIEDNCPEKVKKTFSNKCMARVAGAEIIKEGVCDFDQSNEVNIENIVLNKPIEKKVGDDLKEYLQDNNSGEEKEEGFYDKERYLILSKIALARNEEDRNKIFQENLSLIIKKDKKTSEGILENKEVLKEKSDLKDWEEKIEKRSEKIKERSLEIFSKFDFFINKLDSILEKIKLRISFLDDSNLKELIDEGSENIKILKEKRAEAWIEFNLLIMVENKEEAADKIKKVEEELVEVKNGLKNSFKIIKEIISIVKK